MKNRDDFEDKIKKTLCNRVGNRCSNPNCSRITSGPHSNLSKSVNIGVASHIKAAAKGGKRYDENQSPEERKSIENGIWLCQSCSKLIDSDEILYTVSQLFEWKAMSLRMLKINEW